MNNLSNDFRFVRLGSNPIDIQFTTARDCGNFLMQEIQRLELIIKTIKNQSNEKEN